MRLADLEGGVHEAFFFLFLITTQMYLAISGQHCMINAWINGNNKKRPNMKLSASKFNEKNVFMQFQKKEFSDVSCTHGRTCVYGRYDPATSD